MKIPSLASDCSAPYCSCVDADLLGASKLDVHFTILPLVLMLTFWAHPNWPSTLLFYLCGRKPSVVQYIFPLYYPSFDYWRSLFSDCIPADK